VVDIEHQLVEKRQLVQIEPARRHRNAFLWAGGLETICQYFNLLPNIVKRDRWKQLSV
jgi:hypothetical protein